MKTLLAVLLIFGTVPAFAQMDATNVNMEKNLVWLTVKSNKNFRVSGDQRVTAMLTTNLSAIGSEVPIRGAAVVPTQGLSVHDCSAGDNCQNPYSDGKFYSGIYKPGHALTVKFSIADLCSTAESATSTLCVSSAYAAPHSMPLTAMVRVILDVASDVSMSKTAYPLAGKAVVQTFVVIQDADQNVRVVEL